MLKIITCKGKINGKSCGNKYSTRKDPKATRSHDRPQCPKCGERVR